MDLVSLVLAACCGVVAASVVLGGRRARLLAGARAQATALRSEAAATAAATLGAAEVDAEAIRVRDRRGLEQLRASSVARSAALGEDLDGRTGALASRVAELAERRRLLADGEAETSGRAEAARVALEGCRELAARRESRLCERSGVDPARESERVVAALLERATLDGQRRWVAVEHEARDVASDRARRLMSLVCERYDGVGATDRLQHAFPVAERSLLEALSDAGGAPARAFVASTGCELVVEGHGRGLAPRSDDPLQRELGRRVLHDLLEGKLTEPTTIQELGAQHRRDLDDEMASASRWARGELQLAPLPAELEAMLGRLRFRSSYSQNQLRHSFEVGCLSGMLAHELGLEVALARRAGLLHDIGKALTHDHEGSHAVLGAAALRRHGESEAVANAVGAHHGDEAPATALAHLVMAADAMSGARPGARREAAHAYVERIRLLHDIAARTHGVERVDIMNAGREVRVFVADSELGADAELDAAAVGDGELTELAGRVAAEISDRVTFAGQVRVTVIRESRVVAVAR